MKHSLKFLLTGALMVLAVTTTFAAPRDTKDDKDAQAQREEKMATRLAEEMKLDAETTAWFKPLYKEMQDTLRALRRPSTPMGQPGDNAKSEKSEKKKLTEKEAAALIEKNFSQTEQEVAIKRYYYAIFMEKMTPTQLVSIFAAQPGRNQNRQNNNSDQQQMGGPGGMPPGGFGGGGFGGPGF